MLAKDIMEPDVRTLRTETPIKEIAKLMIVNDISGLPVVDEHNVVLGVVSELDLMRKQIRPDEPSLWAICVWGINKSDKIARYEDAVRKYMGETAGDIMTAPAVTVDEIADIETVGKLMFDKAIKRVFVTKNGTLTGVISRSAFVKVLLAQKER